MYSEPCRKSKMNIFSVKPLTIFAKGSILDVWQGLEYVSHFIQNIMKVIFLLIRDKKGKNVENNHN